MLKLNKKRSAFTIVELLVVIVVIAILAAITIVSYAGISQRAVASALQSDLDNAAKLLKMYQIDNNVYPTSLDADNCPIPEDDKYCLKLSQDEDIEYSASNYSNPQTFSLYAIKGNVRYLITNESGAVEATQVVATGGTVTDSNGYRIHTFISSDTFIATSGGGIEVLIVAGGGGGSSGGAGAGGMIYNTAIFVTPQTYTVTIGNGGIGGNVSGTGRTNGQNSTFGSLIAIGGGYGGKTDRTTDANSGGSGGGGGSTSTVQDDGGAGTFGQGNTGGTVSLLYRSSPYPSAGGGGAGAVGNGPTSNSIAGNGGNGLVNLISGASVYYSGGGGGATYRASGTNGSGGLGGGGAGGTNGVAGTANTGGGGGGTRSGGIGGAGGSGIVIIRYMLF